MENMREKADYDVIYDVTREDLEALKPLDQYRRHR